MNLRQIEVFRAIMLTGSVSDAARFLNVSQPNISRLLRHTEDQIGFQLFERIKGRLYPTQEANILYAEVEKAYRNVTIINDIAQDLAESRVGRLRVVCSPSLGVALVPQAITRFREGREGLRVSLEILPQAELSERVLTHQADLGISIFPCDHPNLKVETLCRGRLVCVLPPAHPLCAQAAVTPADIRAYPLISYDRDTPQGQIIDDAFTEMGLQRLIAIEVRFGHTACSFVQAGAGIALVDEFSLMGSAFPGLVLRPFHPARLFTMSLLRDRLRPASRSADHFIVQLRQLASDLRQRPRTEAPPP